MKTVKFILFFALVLLFASCEQSNEPILSGVPPNVVIGPNDSIRSAYAFVTIDLNVDSMYSSHNVGYSVTFFINMKDSLTNVSSAKLCKTLYKDHVYNSDIYYVKKIILYYTNVEHQGSILL